MPKIRYEWMQGNPPRPGVYMTHRNTTYLTRRYWDGSCWYLIEEGNSRGGQPFKWPKDSIEREPPKGWYAKRHMKPGDSRWFLRKIHDKKPIIYGLPVKHYEPDEIIRYLVHTKILPTDWKECFQQKMRDIDFK